MKEMPSSTREARRHLSEDGLTCAVISIIISRPRAASALSALSCTARGVGRGTMPTHATEPRLTSPTQGDEWLVDDKGVM